MEALELEDVSERLRASGVYAAIVYGSFARGEAYNDVDLAVFTDTDLLEIAGELPDIFDVHAFHDLPLYVRHRVLKEGDLLFCTDEDRFYDEVIAFTREYEYFEPRYREYLDGVKQRG